MKTFHASIYATADRYNPVLRATVPGCIVVRMDARLPGQSNTSPVPEFYGNTRAEAKANAIAALKGLGLSGTLSFH